jgi:primosomal protein N'
MKIEIPAECPQCDFPFTLFVPHQQLVKEGSEDNSFSIEITCDNCLNDFYINGTVKIEAELTES